MTPSKPSTKHKSAQWIERPATSSDEALLGKGTRIYRKQMPFGGVLQCFVTPDNVDGWHLSLSHVMVNDQGTPRPGRLPTYGELKEARYRFCPPEVTMAQLFPPTEEFVNIHETTLHLWQVPGETGHG